MTMWMGKIFKEAAIPQFPFALDFSNDGKLLACATTAIGNDERVIRVLRTDTGEVVTSYWQADVEKGRAVAFIENGRELLFLFQRSGDQTQLYRVALDSREPTELKWYPSGTHNHAIVRDRQAKRFAVLGNQVEIWETSSSKILHTIEGANSGYQVHAAFSADGERIYVYGTIEKVVVCYDVNTAKEIERWDAPRRFGEQVLISPNERFLLICGTSHKGLFIYDRTSKKRLLADKDEIFTFNEDSLWRPWVVSCDSSLLACLKGNMWSLRLPELENISTLDSIIHNDIRSWAAAWAWDAPIVAFGLFEEPRLLWFPLSSS